MEKKFLSHLPARLVIGHRWYIIYYQVNPSTGKRERFRETFDLNRIKDLKERAKQAQHKLDEINKLLPIGFPFKIDVPRKGLTPILEAVDFAFKIKMQSDRPRTKTTYTSVVDIFGKWLKKQKLDKMIVGDFTKTLAFEYMDFQVIERKIGASTYNNYLTRMKALFNVLISRSYITENPFVGIPKKIETAKRRRTFTEVEKGLVAKHAYDKDPQLFLIILLVYHCFIRPGELQRLQIKMFNFSNGTIELPGSITKNKRDRTVTIPDIVKPYFYQDTFTKVPGNYFVFGPKLVPHPDQTCGHNSMNYRHKKLLVDLKKRKLLEDTTGLSLYSWKDTGVTDASDFSSLPDLMKQLGHTDPKVTMIYYQQKKVLKPFKQMQNKLV